MDNFEREYYFPPEEVDAFPRRQIDDVYRRFYLIIKTVLLNSQSLHRKEIECSKQGDWICLLEGKGLSPNTSNEEKIRLQAGLRLPSLEVWLPSEALASVVHDLPLEMRAPLAQDLFWDAIYDVQSTTENYSPERIRPYGIPLSKRGYETESVQANLDIQEITAKHPALRRMYYAILKGELDQYASA